MDRSKNTPKIIGFLAEKNIVVFIYRKTNKIHYLVRMQYYKNKEVIAFGSRFYGKLYPSRCDISPDGRHFLYFAMRGTSKEKYDNSFDYWTAICSPPTITAQFFLGHYYTWSGGGRFLNKKHIVIKGFDEDTLTQKSFGQYQISAGSYNDWEIGKDWELIENYKEKEMGIPIPKYWQKSNGKLILKRKLEYDEIFKSRGQFDRYSYTLIDNKTKNQTPLIHCVWADFDNFGRLITSQGSKIIIYKNYKEIIENSPKIFYDLEVANDITKLNKV